MEKAQAEQLVLDDKCGHAKRESWRYLPFSFVLFRPLFSVSALNRSLLYSLDKEMAAPRNPQRRIG